MPDAVPTSTFDDGTEATVEPWHDDELDDRKGYDPDFLGLSVPLPTLADRSKASTTDAGDIELRYEHFSLVMNKERRLAFFTASNVTAEPGAKKPEPGKAYGRKPLGGLGENDREKWFTDPRIPATHQLPDRFFNRDRQAFDKGHLVRRDDVTWGRTYAEVRRANGDTYHVTNCSPQVAGYNQSRLKGLWGRLENEVLDQAGGEQLTVFAGPVFAENDQRFAGVDDESPIDVKIPRQYWKVVVAVKDGALQSFGFLLRQDLSGVDYGAPGGEEFVVPDEWKGHMRPLNELAELIHPVVLPDVVIAADQHGLV